jgi:hypothetical protein
VVGPLAREGLPTGILARLARRSVQVIIAAFGDQSAAPDVASLAVGGTLATPQIRRHRNPLLQQRDDNNQIIVSHTEQQQGGNRRRFAN